MPCQKSEYKTLITDGILTEQNGTGRCKPCLRFTHIYPKISRRTGKRTAHTLWNESYAINSVGGARLDVLIGYIKNQPKELLDKVTRGNF
jgi:Transposase IS200 like